MCLCIMAFFATVGDITAPLCRVHRRTVCVDGRHGQLHRCGESGQSYHQPDSEPLHNMSRSISGVCCVTSAVSLFQIEPYIPYEFTCEGMLQRVNVLIEKQVGWTSLGSVSHRCPVNTNVLSWIFLSGLLFQHDKLASSEHTPGGKGRGQSFL